MIETADTPDIFGSTIFCDDIRFEADGKISYIGSYLSGMQVHTSFPAVIPKFGFGVTLWQRRSTLTKDMVFKIFLPGDPDDQPSIQAPSQPLGPPDMDPNPGAPYVVMAFQLVAAPLVIKEPGWIRSRVHIRDKLYPLGSLGVTQGEITQGPPIPKLQTA